MNILVLDDEREIADLVEVYLKNENYNVFKFYDAKEAINCIESQKLDFAILDVMIKDVDGFKICKMIRDKGLNFPVIMLTAKIEDKDKIQGLTLGADDYITKPFSVTEVLARIKANIRRSTQYSKPAEPENETLVIGDLVMNLTDYTVTKKNVRVDLTAKEYEILKLLLQNPKKVYTKEQMYSLIWNDAYLGDENAVNVHISRLRNKIEDNPRSPKYVITVWGIGYKLGDLS